MIKDIRKKPIQHSLSEHRIPPFSLFLLVGFFVLFFCSFSTPLNSFAFTGSVPSDYPYAPNQVFFDLQVPTGCSVVHVDVIVSGSQFLVSVRCSDSRVFNSNLISVRPGIPDFHISENSSLTESAYVQ